MNTRLKFPFYIKVSLLLTGLYVLISMLYITQALLLPLIFAAIISIMTNPVINFLVRKKINRIIAITGVLITVILVLAVLIVLLASQASRLGEALPQLAEKFQELVRQSVTWASGYFSISEQKLNTWISSSKIWLIESGSANIGITLSSIGDLLVAILLIPVYIFLILFYQPQLIRFVHNLFGIGNNNIVTEVLIETKTIIQSYLAGLFAEFIIIAVLNSAGLLLLGIDYAILLGIIGALFNIIPYIGGLFAVLIFMVIALVTKSPVYVLYVAVMYAVIQLIDNNYIVPKIIGSKVKLNALISFIGVIAGAALWGIPGMFLSIPLIAIFKVIFDRIETLKPWGILMGDLKTPAIKMKKKPQSGNDTT